MPIDEQEPIHGFFGLTYSNYLVLHRTLMEKMPVEWQQQFVLLLREMEQRCRAIPQPSNFIVKAAVEHEVSQLNDRQMEIAGVSVERGEDDDVYWDAEAREIPSWHRVMIPIEDPVPHYRDRQFKLPPTENETHIAVSVCDQGHYGSSACGHCGESVLPETKACGKCGYKFVTVKDVGVSGGSDY